MAAATWWIGTSLTRRGLVVHALPPMVIPWNQVREIEVQTQLGSKIVVVHHGSDASPGLARRTTLSAPDHRAARPRRGVPGQGAGAALVLGGAPRPRRRLTSASALLTGSGRPGCSPPRASPYDCFGTITLRRKTQTTTPSWL